MADALSIVCTVIIQLTKNVKKIKRKMDEKKQRIKQKLEKGIKLMNVKRKGKKLGRQKWLR